MEINSINNNITNLNNTPSLQLNKSAANNQIEKVENGSLNLSVNQYNNKRDELSLNIQSINEGLAISKISQNALDKQQDFLKDIKDNLQKMQSNDINLHQKDQLKQDVTNDLRNFNEVAFETKYKNQLLLTDQNDEQYNQVEISTSTNSFTMQTPNTSEFANNIFNELNNSNISNPNQIQNVVEEVDRTSTQIENISTSFEEFENQLKDSAKENIKTQQELFTQNKSNQNRDFGRDSTDFNKTNINANAGYLAASQANIVQEQSIRLLS
ncbi:MAG: flagellin [Campylobacterota bacterium]